MNFNCTFTALCFVLAFITGSMKPMTTLNGYNPGPCNDAVHGKQVLIKDRDDNEVILFCAKDKAGYRWKSTHGSKNTVGEFFNPAYDCSDVLDKLQDAKDGFYWITLNGPYLHKVWCDVSTDGGGYMLIGRQNNSETWKVPSNPKPVDPYGVPHWSSSLGDAPIVDFRVQMASRDDFKDTKAHWSLRLQSKRPLKNLMITSNGCDQRASGIGNIAYVKDLLTEKIVSTKLRCSKFGFAHHPMLQFGWAMMNSCLQKPCPPGFAYHPLVQSVQTDNYGGFSFSTTGEISGMQFNATAFVGCDNGDCCGCYGPEGGTKNYCTQNCKAINGGTVTKNVFTWYWVRSSLPKRLWKKCMDYQLKGDDGKLSSYKLVGHSVVPIEGHCSKTAAVLHDGIVVAPDSSSAQNVPAIDGLLEYRKDKQELCVRANKTWSALAQQQKVNKEIKRLENLINILNSSLFMAIPHYKECFQFNWLRESNRNREHTSTAYLCDKSLATGWYRFGGGAGFKIATSCVPEHRCQGDFTGWMTGYHPTVSDKKVSRTVCFSHGSNCCHWSNHIEIINCGLFYIYKLVPPSRCRARYCGSNK